MHAWKLSLFVFSVIVSVLLYYVADFSGFGEDGTNRTQMYLDDHYWAGDHDDENVNVTQLTLGTSNTAMSDLKYRLENSRVRPSFSENNFKYGFHSQTVKKTLDVWMNKYKWKEIELAMNSFNNFLTKIEGLDVHFVHIKPRSALNSPNAVVRILLIHGWPSTFFEFFRLIALLEDEKSQTGEQIAFEIILPSVPGVAFSAGSSKPGFNFAHVARVLVKLMDRLGHERFYVMTSGLGSFIGKTMAVLYPSHVLGLYTTLPLLGRSPSNFFKLVIGYVLPRLMFNSPKQDMSKISPVIKKLILFNLGIEPSYLELDNLRPDTLGVSLTDSPAGLAAFVLEKMALLSDQAAENEADGGLGDRFNDKDVITQVMLFWITSSMPSALRLIDETFIKTVDQFNYYNTIVPSSVPCGIAVLPKDIIRFPRTLLTQTYRNIIQYTDLKRGGHYALLEEPTLIYDDLLSFIKKAQAFHEVNSREKLIEK